MEESDINMQLNTYICIINISYSIYTYIYKARIKRCHEHPYTRLGLKVTYIRVSLEFLEKLRVAFEPRERCCEGSGQGQYYTTVSGGVIIRSVIGVWFTARQRG